MRCARDILVNVVNDWSRAHNRTSAVSCLALSAWVAESVLIEKVRSKEL